MTISIIIPAYNEENYIGKTLTSIKNLDRDAWELEIIVVDAQSADKTAEISTSFGARVIYAPHRGIGFARQKGLLEARGEVVAFTDADTQVPPDWLRKIIHALTQNGVVGVYGEYTVMDGPLWFRVYINYCLRTLMRFVHLFGVDMPGGQNIAFWRKKGIEAGGFPVDFQSVEDFEIIKRLKRVGKVVYSTSHPVFSSGRRGKEGIRIIPRVLGGVLRYYVTGKADSFTFPTIR